MAAGVYAWKVFPAAPAGREIGEGTGGWRRNGHLGTKMEALQAASASVFP